jgi:menaquinone-dependent protoporphyrinogen oxidase
MTVLVTWYSKHGATAEIARAIAEELVSEGIDVVAKPMADVETLFPYDAFVVGSAIYMGRWPREARRFVYEHVDLLAERPVWLFSSGPTDSPDVTATAESFRDGSIVEDVRPLEHRVFAGKLVKSELGVGERLIASALHAPDVDLRDWTAIAAWAGAIARELSGVRGLRNRDALAASTPRQPARP